MVNERPYDVDTEAVVWRRMDDLAVLLDVERGEYSMLNDSATAIWSALAEGRTPREAADRLVDHHGAPREVADRDVRHFVQQCVDRRWIR
jgi:hypothetical protein